MDCGCGCVCGWVVGAFVGAFVVLGVCVPSPHSLQAHKSSLRSALTARFARFRWVQMTEGSSSPTKRVPSAEAVARMGSMGEQVDARTGPEWPGSS